LRSSSGQTRILALQFQIFFLLWIRLDFGPRFCGVSASRMPLARSRRQVASSNEYKPFTAQQSSEAASRSSGRFGFLQDAQLIFCGESASLCFRDYFGIPSRGQHRIGCRCTTPASDTRIVRWPARALVTAILSEEYRRSRNHNQIRQATAEDATL